MDPSNDTPNPLSTSEKSMTTLSDTAATNLATATTTTTTAVDDSDILPLSKKKLHHFSHISADSATTIDDDDDLSLEHHRRTTSSTDSIYSAVTEATEPPESVAASSSTKKITTTTTMAESESSTSVKVNVLPIQRDEQLDPWGSNPYDQQDLASTLRFSRNPNDNDDDEDDEQKDNAPGLAHIITTSTSGSTSTSSTSNSNTSSSLNTRSILSPSVGRPSLTLSSTEDDPLERMDREFERLTNGQPLQLTQTSPLAFDFDREQLDDPRGIVERSISDKDKRIRLSKLFSRAASNGDMNRVADMLDNFRDWIDIEAQDEDGTTPLIYAACFGHVEIAFMLLEAGAMVDARDKFGWTPLVWATNNKHDNMVRLLLEQGASTTAQTAKGHTIVDFLRHDPNDNTRIVQIFQEPGRRDSISSNGSLFRNNSSLGDDLFYQAGIEGFEEMMAENERRYKMAMESASAFEVDMADLSLADQPQRDDEGEFDWERCLPDQMFVFSSKDIRHIMETTIKNMEPTRSKAYKPIPAYVLFLAARFAHYFSSAELLDELLEAASSAIISVVRARPEDMTLTAYWVSNTSVLLHFLRKDPGLSLSSGFHQVKIEALILDMLQMLVMDAERRIEKILEPAMLDHDTIAGLEEVKFQSDWAYLWRKSLSLGSKAGAKAAASAGAGASANPSSTASTASGAAAPNSTTTGNRRSSSPLSPNSAAMATSGAGAGAGTGSTSPSPRPLTRTSSSSTVPLLNRPPSPRQRKISPRTITTMLSSLLFVMQTYDVHPDIINYVIAQLLHFVSCEVFNRMMTNKKLLSRSKALQTRLNLSILEDWIRMNNLSPKLSEQFEPLVQLLQLLQVLSLQEDFPTWVETLKKLEKLNPTQVKRVVSSYRFEVNEPRLPEEITQYVLQVAADTERMVRRQMMDRKRERPMTMLFESSSVKSATASGATTPASSTPTPGTTSTMAGATATTSSALTAAGSRTSTAMEDAEALSNPQVAAPPTPAMLLTEAEKARARQRRRDQEEEASLLSETRNSKSWLPFTIPANMAEREHGIERVFVPLVPDEMMSLLDTHSSIIQDHRDSLPTQEFTRTWATLQELNSRRGPNAQHSHITDISHGTVVDNPTTSTLTFYGAVLHLRGDTVCRQPHVAPSGNVLLWNGEIFDGIAVDHHENDGQVLMAKLESISEVAPEEHSSMFLDLMSKIEGPYAFVYFHARTKKIYFGRDCLGRRSLLWHRPSAKDTNNLGSPFILTSVGYSSFKTDLLPLDEVPADGIYCLASDPLSRSLTHYPWVSESVASQLSTEHRLFMRLPFGKVNTTLPSEEQLPPPFEKDLKFDQAHPELIPPMTDDMKRAVESLRKVLGDSVQRRVQDIPRTGDVHDARVGILFSGGLDCLCLAALADKFLPEGEAIDLLNVGFENPRSEKAKAAEEALALKRLKKLQLSSNGQEGETSTTTAATTTASRSNSDSSKKYNVPDRITGLESLKELRILSPNRHWNFVQVNVPFEEATAQRSEILERIAPLDTVMDLSIAMAFWFASRGVGEIRLDDGSTIPYTSQAKVLLSGLGADEQLGGYSRHKDQFTENGWEGLIQELQLDLDRISTRNLGRDDRIISDHGKEARYPFLGAHVVDLLSSLRVDLKCDLRYPRGVGEKILLRHLARDLGFTRASSHWKRAVQFGARTAKMTESGRSEIGQAVVARH
ncbi:hypothetical protein BGZ94_010303 [Podila epigama]|nr:hypothetical protein BGZ94_010303 [Podila epigama]